MADDVAPEGKKRGPPSPFKPEMVEQARKLAQLGATDVEIADFFEVTKKTVYVWKHRHPEFAAAIATGKEGPDDRVVRSLYQKAVGYSFDSEKIFCDKGVVTRVPVVEHVPPSDTACIFWLKNRQGWRDKVDVEASVGMTVKISGADADL
jgi:hypothetical protein